MFIPLAQKIKQDLTALGNTAVRITHIIRVAVKLDNISITQYLNKAEIDPLLNV